ncbi:uncharacterized protein LOC125568001 [Nematostella vectensis]|uniref:uncharacterized protein LOC125568001 n=1 Tax=Nematostella vectensis TaxID=45351 RepID=UPI0020770CEC|nr:uncharacterized protein LOC125568001 [Nematostella vectensis]
MNLNKLIGVWMIAYLVVTVVTGVPARDRKLDRFIGNRLRNLQRTTVSAFACYKDAHGFRSSHRGGPLWNNLKKMLHHQPPSAQTEELKRLGSCLVWLETLRKPLETVRRSDETEFPCGDSTLTRRLDDVQNIVDTLIALYKTYKPVRPSPPHKPISISKLKNLAKNDAANLDIGPANLQGSQRGIAVKYLVNLELLDLVTEAANRMQNYCVPSAHAAPNVS